MKKQKKLVLKNVVIQPPTYALFFKLYPDRIKNDELGHGSNSQTRRCKNYARAKGYIVENRYGYNFPINLLYQVKHMLQRRFAIVLDSFARVGRNQEEIDAFCKEATELGASVESLGYDLEKPAKDQFKDTIKGAMDKYEHQMRSIKAQQAAIKRHVNKEK